MRRRRRRPGGRAGAARRAGGRRCRCAGRAARAAASPRPGTRRPRPAGSRSRSAAARSSASRPVAVTASTGRPARAASAARANGRSPGGAVRSRSVRPPDRAASTAGAQGRVARALVEQDVEEAGQAHEGLPVVAGAARQPRTARRAGGASSVRPAGRRSRIPVGASQPVRTDLSSRRAAGRARRSATARRWRCAPTSAGWATCWASRWCARRARSCSTWWSRSARLSRGDSGGDGDLAALLEDVDVETAARLVRAFGTYFHLANVTEQVHRAREMRAERVGKGGWLAQTTERIRASGLDAAEVAALVARIAVRPVFTAHPTEAARRSILSKRRRVAELLERRGRPAGRPADRRGHRPALADRRAAAGPAGAAGRGPQRGLLPRRADAARRRRRARGAGRPARLARASSCRRTPGR